MTTKAFPWAMALGLTTFFLLTGCSRPGDPKTVEAGKDAQGNTYVHIDGKQVDRNLDQAGKELKRSAKELGQAVQDGARQVDEKVGPVAREVLNDSSITARIKAKILADPALRSLQVGVDTVNGRVALNGNVPTAAQKEAVEKLARETPGVRSIADVIEVTSEGAPR